MSRPMLQACAAALAALGIVMTAPTAGAADASRGHDSVAYSRAGVLSDRKIYAGRSWGEDYSYAKVVDVAGTNYLFLMRFDDGRVRIRRTKIDSRIRGKVESLEWSPGHRAVTVFSRGASGRLVSVKTGDGQLRIRELKPGGTIGRETDSSRLTSGWTAAEHVRLGGRDWVHLLNGTTGATRVYEITADGRLGPSVYDAPPTSRRTSLGFIQAGGATYRCLWTLEGDRLQINRMNDDGTVGQTTSAEPIGAAWTAVVPFVANGQAFVLLHDRNAETMRVREITAAGTLGRVAEDLDWGHDFDLLAPFTSLGATYLFCLNTREQRYRTYSLAPVHPVTFSGPLVGAVTDSTARLWAWAATGGELSVTYGPADSPKRETLTTAMTPPNGGPGFMAKPRLAGLEADTLYDFALRHGTNSYPGRFRTAPAPGRPTAFALALTSCMNVDSHPVQLSWNHLAAAQPDLHLILGDTTYANSTDIATVWKWHLWQRAEPRFARVIRTIPTYAIWDDHDFSSNNSDGDDPGKRDALEAFRAVFANPSYGTPSTPGTFYRFAWGDVDFFLLDGRFHRSPYDAPDDEQKRMLGDRQFMWLTTQLRESKAAFKVLASGTTIAGDKSERWNRFGFSLRRLYDLIARERVEGVVYLSGDIHECAITVHPRATTGFYDLHELTSSGIARGMEFGFMTLSFDTTVADPKLDVKIIQSDGRVSRRHTIRQSQLTFSPSTVESP